MKIFFYLIILLSVTEFSGQSVNNYEKIWGTYFGKVGFAAETSILNRVNNLIVAGSVASIHDSIDQNPNFYNQLVTSDEPEMQYNPNYDGVQSFIAEFSTDGFPLKVVYFPGTQLNLQLNNHGEYILTGTTKRHDLGTDGVWLRNSITPDNNRFVAKLNRDFSINWFTYLPEGRLSSFCFDSTNNIYGASSTSILDSIGSANSYQSEFNNYYDSYGNLVANGCLFKLDDSGHKLWVTYTGCIETSDVLYHNDELVLCSQFDYNELSEYNDLNYTVDAYQVEPSHSVISKFHVNDGNRIYSTYIGDINTIVEDVEIIDNQYVFSGEQALLPLSTNDIISSNAYQSNFGGGYNDRLLFSTDLEFQPIWGTYLGGTNRESNITNGSSLKVLDDAIYVFADSFSQDFVIESPHTINASNSGIVDVHVFKFSSTGDFIWGSFIGGDRLTFSIDVSIASDSTFFAVGRTQSVSGISSPGAYQEEFDYYPFNSNNVAGIFGNAYVMKFSGMSNDEIPVLNLENIYYVCPNESITIEANIENVTYLWGGLIEGDLLNNDINGESVEISIPGNYSLTVTNPEGNSTSHMFIVALKDELQIDEFILSENDATFEVNYPESTVYSLDGITWQASNTFYNLPKGIYTLYAKSSEYCGVAQYTFAIIDLYNFISPNGDGLNDVFIIPGTTVFDDASVSIFNRYGKLLRQSIMEKNIDFYWDGTYKGRVVPSGDYWYLVNMRDGTKISGSITVKSN